MNLSEYTHNELLSFDTINSVTFELLTCSEETISEGLTQKLEPHVHSLDGMEYEYGYTAQNGDVIGRIHYVKFDSSACITWVNVRPFAQEIGLGTQLFEYVIQNCESDSEIEIIYCHFDMNDSKSIGEQLGFTKESKIDGETDRWYSKNVS